MKTNQNKEAEVTQLMPESPWKANQNILLPTPVLWGWLAKGDIENKGLDMPDDTIGNQGKQHEEAFSAMV